MAMVEVEFRDGTKLVPEHVADILRPYETHTMTHAEAIKKANTGMAAKFANDAQTRIVRGHMDEVR